MKSTIRDIAAAAHVSTATVDRVLNGRPGVKATNRHRVLEAATRLGYLPETGNVAMPARPARLEFILPVGTNLFLDELATHIEDYCRRLPLVASCRLHRLATAQPAEFVAALDELSLNTAGIGVVAVDDPRTRAAIDRMSEAGMRVVTIVSDLPSSRRADYIGIDNRVAGRTAGKLMGQMIRDETNGVALFLGSRKYRGHEEREAGFRAVLGEEFPGIDVVEAVEIDDSSEKGYQAALSIFARRPRIDGVYCAGGGRSGVIRAVKERFPHERPLVVCHDLTVRTREELLSGAIDIVIDQNARLVAEQATIHLLGTLASSAPYLTKKLIEPRIITRENIPAV